MKRYTMYLDESGIADLTDKQYPDFLLTGLVLDHDEDSEVSAYFNFIKRKYRLDGERSFHAYDLFENKTSKFYLPDTRAKKLCESLSELINIAPLSISITSLNKAELRNFLNIQGDDDFKGSEQKKRDKELAYEVLSTHLFFWFGSLTKKEHARGALVAESRRNADHTLLRTYLRCKEPDTFQLGVLKKSCNDLRGSITSIRFENKIGVWPGLELADLISYVSFLKLYGRIQKFKHRGLTLLWASVEKKIEKDKIQIITKPGFKKYIHQNRVRKAPKIT